MRTRLRDVAELKRTAAPVREEVIRLRVSEKVPLHGKKLSVLFAVACLLYVSYLFTRNYVVVLASVLWLVVGFAVAIFCLGLCAFAAFDNRKNPREFRRAVTGFVLYLCFFPVAVGFIFLGLATVPNAQRIATKDPFGSTAVVWRSGMSDSSPFHVSFCVSCLPMQQAISPPNYSVDCGTAQFSGGWNSHGDRLQAYCSDGRVPKITLLSPVTEAHSVEVIAGEPTLASQPRSLE